jgi:hypothetical protein
MSMADETSAIREVAVRAPTSKRRAGKSSGILRHSPWDALLVGLAGLHGVLLLLVPSVGLVAIGLWWNANTISHNFIHRPFFRSRTSNRLFSAYLSLMLGLPQSLWKAKHLAHHRDDSFRWDRFHGAWLGEVVLVILLWTGLIAFAPQFLLTVYLPGWIVGLALCELHGRFEHSHGTVSHYGRLYNTLFFNDGYHFEHHARPGRHWTALSVTREAPQVNVSRWPAVLRWLELCGLDGLEELVCRFPFLQRFVLSVHEPALMAALSTIPPPRRIVIVGGGLFPRTAMLLQRLVPEAELVLVDARADHLERAKNRLNGGVECVTAFCTAARLPELACNADLIVIPLALRGRRADFYQHPPASYVLVHDWLWRPRGQSTVISWLLLKRLNLVRA